MKINLNIENKEKHRILNMHKILKEQTNPTINYNIPSDSEKLVNLVINENLCDFSNFSGFSITNKEIVPTVQAFRYKGRNGIIGVSKIKGNNYNQGDFVFFDFTNIKLGGILNHYLLRKEGTYSLGSFTCNGLKDRMNEIAKSVELAVEKQGYKSLNKFPVEARTELNNPEIYDKITFEQISKQLSMDPTFNPKLYPETLPKVFFKSKVGSGAVGVTEQQKKVIDNLITQGWKGEYDLDQTQRANFIEIDLKDLYPNIFNTSIIMWQPRTLNTKEKNMNWNTLDVSEQKHSQCMAFIDEYKNVYNRYRTASIGELPQSFNVLKDKIQVCYNNFSNKNFGKKLRELGVVKGQYSQINPTFKINEVN